MTWWQWVLVPVVLVTAWVLYAALPSLVTYLRMRRM
jgi:hypothetical protein